jgi:hypothetical protein
LPGFVWSKLTTLKIGQRQIQIRPQGIETGQHCRLCLSLKFSSLASCVTRLTRFDRGVCIAAVETLIIFVRAILISAATIAEPNSYWQLGSCGR